MYRSKTRAQIPLSVRIARFPPRPTLTHSWIEWFEFAIQLPDFYLQRLRARVTMQTIFRALGNTGAANERRWHSTTLVPDHMQTAEMRKIHPIIQMDPVYQLRHPDPKLVATLAVTDPSLQVSGSWRKVPLKSSGGMTSRMGFASFVFEGRVPAISRYLISINPANRPLVRPRRREIS